MSFYTALTGLNGSSADISATSNNIANVGTTGFKRSRAEFGDIFATSPLQNSSSSIGSVVDTFLFFSIAFVGTEVPWITLSLGDLAVKFFVALVMLIPFRLLLNTFKPAA